MAEVECRLHYSGEYGGENSSVVASDTAIPVDAELSNPGPTHRRHRSASEVIVNP